MNVLNAAELLARAALKMAPVEIEGGGRVFVRELSVAQRAVFVDKARNDPTSIAVWLASECTTDASGAKLFANGDAAKLADASPRIVDALGTAALKLSGMSGEEKESEGEA